MVTAIYIIFSLYRVAFEQEAIPDGIFQTQYIAHDNPRVNLSIRQIQRLGSKFLLGAALHRLSRRARGYTPTSIEMIGVELFDAVTDNADEKRFFDQCVIQAFNRDPTNPGKFLPSFIGRRPEDSYTVKRFPQRLWVHVLADCQTATYSYAHSPRR